MKIREKEKVVLRDLSKRYMALCCSEQNLENIDFWQNFNSFENTRPPVFVSLDYSSHLEKEFDDVLPPSEIENPELKTVENWLQRRLWENQIPDDRVCLPWFPVRAEMYRLTEGEWGIEMDREHDQDEGKGWKWNTVINAPEDLTKLQKTPHEVLDPFPEKAKILTDIFGDILPVHVDRSTVYSSWGGVDLSTAAGALLGLQEFMLAFYEKPNLVHQLMAFMRDAVIENLKQGESAGDWSPAESNNYGVPAFFKDLPQPKANSHGAQLKDLCFFIHAQEFECVGPEQHKEFLLDYQVPIMELFGAVNYGCCESLENKIDLLRAIPNLRKILAGPIANIEKIAEHVGKDFLISWRPNPAIMVSNDFHSEDIRKNIRNAMRSFKGCHVEIVLKELMTVQNDMSRLIEWAKVAREEAELFC